MPVCKKCSTRNGLGAINCKSCGRVIPVDEGYPCPNCSKINGPFSKRCQRCNYSYITKKIEPRKGMKQQRVFTKRRTKLFWLIIFCMLAISLYWIRIGWIASEENDLIAIMEHESIEIQNYRDNIVRLYNDHSVSKKDRILKLEKIQIEINKYYEKIESRDSSEKLRLSEQKLLTVFGYLIDTTIYAKAAISTNDTSKLNESLVMVTREMENYERLLKEIKK